MTVHKIQFNRNSIIVRLLLPMLVVLLLQSLLFAETIFHGGVIAELNNNAMDILNERVFRRKGYLENDILQRWTNFSKFEYDVQEKMKSFLLERDIQFSELQSNQDLITEFLVESVDYTVAALRQHMVTGIFIVLQGKNEIRYPGIYFRDLDPLFNPNDNSDISMEKGPSSIAKTSGISLGRDWTPQFILAEDDDSSNFFYKPYKITKAYPDSKFSDLGYWSKPFRLSQYDMEVITYSIPLINDDGESYGVIGIELTTDYLRKILHYDEIIENRQGSYVLGINSEDDMVFENVVSSGSILKTIIGNDKKLVFNKEAKYNKIYELRSSRSETKTVYGSIHNLNLYNRNSPFEKDKWVLIGIVEEDNLLKAAKQVKFAVIIALIIYLIIGVIGIILAGMIFVMPIKTLVKKLSNSNPQEVITLEKINITEIDNLAYAIEVLSSKVSDSASKLSQIIGMVNIPIGAFEHSLDEDKVFCTDGFFNIIGMERYNTDTQYIDYMDFYNILEIIQNYPENNLEDIYRYVKKDNSIIWIRLNIQETHGKVLGIIEDVTDEVMEKRKIEYERDHDLLTHLINRRAFRIQVKKQMKEELKIAAFVMWDLDNLKYINDTYGHDYGDQYIKTAAEILSEISFCNGVVSRMSGDEFLAFIYGYEGKDEIRNIINKMQENLYNTTICMPDNNIIRIRASAGIAWYPDDSDDYYELIKYSDFAMYEIKNTIKGNIGEFDKEVYNKKSFLLHSQEELNRFIDEELVEFVFQPIVDAKNGSVFAYEALMRSKIETLKSPLDIIRLARSQSKLHAIEKLTFFKAMEAFKHHEEDFGNARIFINSIPNHILSKKDLQVFEEKYKTDLNRLVIEIIESEQLDDKITRKKQDMITKWNSSIALDDFGSGYNSEIALLVLSPSFIKIDISIIRGIDRDRNRQKLLNNLLSYAKDRNIKVIAEGVETKKEMDTLIKFGVDYLQGYYIGRPNKIPQQISEKIVEEIYAGNMI
ncbi:MAG: EAL domain-containing protein [Epulopiscium sp.]|nr:EAL domain-containing protein [Candidatus Epulonipiscium sp.]